MKKILAVLFVGIALTSCSSDDNESNSEDPVFSQPYVELTSLDELVSGSYAYVGNKIGDRKVGLITDASQCKKKDYLIVHREAINATLDSITYNNFRMDKVDGVVECISGFKFPRLLHKNNLVREGYLKTSIEDGYKEEVVKEDENGVLYKEQVYKRKVHYKGELEIGFQAGYLRIEDQLSDYKRMRDEKVYLYFKKI